MARPSMPPMSALILAALGLPCLIYGLALLLGFGSFGAPVLMQPAAGIALIVSGIALLGSAAFPLVLRRLAQRDAAQQQVPYRSG